MRYRIAKMFLLEQLENIYRFVTIIEWSEILLHLLKSSLVIVIFLIFPDDAHHEKIVLWRKDVLSNSINCRNSSLKISLLSLVHSSQWNIGFRFLISVDFHWNSAVVIHWFRRLYNFFSILTSSPCFSLFMDAKLDATPDAKMVWTLLSVILLGLY